MRDTTIAPNIVQTTRPDGSTVGFRVYVRVPDPVTGKSRKIGKRFPPGTALEVLAAYRDAAAIAASDSDGDATGFTADARRYLALKDVQAMPAIKSRTFEIETWIGIFGDTPREAIEKNAINDALHTLKESGYANSTCNKFRTALMSLWTTLDGRSAANPVRDAVVFQEADLIPRGQSYELLTMILEAISDEPGLTIDRATLYREIWAEPMTTVAKRYGVS